MTRLLKHAALTSAQNKWRAARLAQREERARARSSRPGRGKVGGGRRAERAEGRAYRQETQAGLGPMAKNAGVVRLRAFSDELQKIALAPPNLLTALKSGPYSTNIGNLSSLKSITPSVRVAPPPPRGSISSATGSTLPRDILGANVRRSVKPAQPNVQAVGKTISPASPARTAPQVTTQAAPTIQGGAQKMQTSPAGAGNVGQGINR